MASTQCSNRDRGVSRKCLCVESNQLKRTWFYSRQSCLSCEQFHRGMSAQLCRSLLPLDLWTSSPLHHILKIESFSTFIQPIAFLVRLRFNRTFKAFLCRSRSLRSLRFCSDCVSFGLFKTSSWRLHNLVTRISQHNANNGNRSWDPKISQCNQQNPMPSKTRQRWCSAQYPFESPAAAPFGPVDLWESNRNSVRPSRPRRVQPRLRPT